MGMLLTSSGFQNDNIKISFAGAAVNITGNAVLIPIYGIDGAVIATLLMGISVVAVSLYYLRIRLQDISFIPSIFRGCVISAISLVPVFLLKEQGKLLQMSAGLILWALLSLLLKEIRKEDYEMVRNLFRRK
jgi:O-antigen/teichoic acid export membrane protein